MVKEAGTKIKKGSVFLASGGTDAEKRNRHRTGSMVAMGAFLLGGIFQVAWLKFTPTALGPTRMGLFGPMMGWFYVVSALFALGLPATITTFVSLHYEKNFGESKRFLCDGNRLILINGIILFFASTLITGVARIVGLIHTYSFIIILTMVMCCIPAMLFWGVNSVLTGFQRIDLISVGNLLFPLGQFAGTVALVSISRAIFGQDSQWNVVAALAGLGVGQVVGLSAAILMMQRTGKVTCREIYTLRQHHNLYGRILRFGGLAAVALVGNSVVQNLTAPLLRIMGHYWLLFGATRAECLVQVGYFSTALLYGLSPMLIAGVGIALVPAISEAEGQGRRDLMQEYYSIALQQSFAIIGMFITLYALFIGPIISLMNGSQYPEAVMAPLAMLMVIGGAGVAVLYVLTNLFLGLKKPALASTLMSCVLGGLVIGIILLSFIFHSVQWAALGFLMPPVLGCVAALTIAHFKLELRFPWWTILEPVACGGAAWAFIHYVMPRQGAIFMFVDIALFLVIYSLGLWLFERPRARGRASAAL